MPILMGELILQRRLTFYRDARGSNSSATKHLATELLKRERT